MARAFSLVLLVFYHLSLLSFADEEPRFNPSCPPFPCGFLSNISFPFTTPKHPECGLLIVENCKELWQHKFIQLGKDGPRFHLLDVKQDNTIVLQERDHIEHIKNDTCRFFQNLTVSSSPFYSFAFPPNITMFKCLPTRHNLKDFVKICNDSSRSIFLDKHQAYDLPSPPAQCSFFRPLLTKTEKHVFLYNMYTDFFFLQVHVTKECQDCHGSGGQCQSDINGNFNCSGAKSGNNSRGGQCQNDVNGNFNCSGTKTEHGNNRLALGLKLGLGIGVPVILIAALFMFIKHHCKKGEYASPNFHSGNTSSCPSSKSDLEEGSVYGVPVFGYCELAEATNNFNQDKELGDGGFGSVYHGKLKDGREVAVKRLYEHNYRRVEQFMNEIKILTRLRHKNLVSLYGCTSRHSQGLLLVYEFVPNGTVADHLHGDQANPCLLTWPIRINIAIETATALAYLHASGIIHRDVKTNNILLDNNFYVKVADFGLSRLFPTDVTHVSTAPQGTPGYVDPEYHQCYQLTEKSDVYSFGVVLIELISSMPAVDISRHKHEINLANLAIDRIQKHAVDELIDPCLGVHSDEEVRRMATSVAELAFLCLQQIKEVRPTMDVVVEELQRIKRGECKPEKVKEEDDDDKEESKTTQQPPPSPPQSEESALLKNIKLPPSPVSVTENWLSNDTTPNVSN